MALFPTTHTHTQHLIPSALQECVCESSRQSIPFYLYMSYITLKIKGKWKRRCDERQRASPLGLFGSAKYAHTQTQTQLISTNPGGLKGERERAYELYPIMSAHPLPVLPERTWEHLEGNRTKKDSMRWLPIPGVARVSDRPPVPP